jgi:hypothetical protein
MKRLSSKQIIARKISVPQMNLKNEDFREDGREIRQELRQEVSGLQKKSPMSSQMEKSMRLLLLFVEACFLMISFYIKPTFIFVYLL